MVKRRAQRSALDLDAALVTMLELKGAFEAVFEAIDRAAFLLDARGTIVHANSAGRAMRDADPTVQGAIREGLLKPELGPLFTYTPILGKNCATQYLALVRDNVGQTAGSNIARAAHAWNLTFRQIEVLRMVVAGRTNSRIAAELGLAERTVEDHIRILFVKARVASRSELVSRVLGG